MKGKRGYYFSVDALIALIIILVVILTVKPPIQKKNIEMSMQEDLLVVLSNLKMSELYAYNSEIQQWYYPQYNITDLNKSVLDQLGEFYSFGKKDKARRLAEIVISPITKQNDNLNITFADEEIYSKGSGYNKADNIWTSRQLISGVVDPFQYGNTSTGYSARAFLSSASKTNYFYFGGYVGDGNISAIAEYNGDIINASIEGEFHGNFNLNINGIHYGTFDEDGLARIQINNPSTYFHSGINYVNFTSDNLYIAGGFIKINYQNSSDFSIYKKYKFPGIQGTVNLYDGFYVPGSLSSMEISLHYKSNYTLFLNFGNVTVFNKSSDTVTTEVVTNAQILQRFNNDYSSLSNKTTPLRMGLQGMIKTGNADVVLITDESGSMDNRMDSDNVGTSRNCKNPLLYSPSTKRINVSQCLDKMFIDIIINTTGNRIALVGFFGDSGSPNKGKTVNTSLSSDSTYLKNAVNRYYPRGGTPICAAINSAYRILNEQSSAGRKKFIIVMSDGIPTHSCGQQIDDCQGLKTGFPSNDEALWWGENGCYGGLDDCEVGDCNCASQNANYSSCLAHNNLGAIVHSIGFGPLSTCTIANKTLKNIADCGGGEYQVADNATLLAEIYQNIAEEIVNIAFTEQISIITGSFRGTTIFPDSYITFTYPATLPTGLLLNIQTSHFGSNDGVFNVPNDAELIDAKVISYSGSKWTSNVTVYNSTSSKNVLQLSNYGSEFLALGDPYVVHIPLEFTGKGNNYVSVRLANSSASQSSGSPNNSIIYTLKKELSSYSPVRYSAKGCIWDITFDDGTTQQVKVPLDYSGTDPHCNFIYGSCSLHNDAIDYAVCKLFEKMDFDGDGQIDVKFTQNDLEISTDEVTGIPYSFGTEAKVVVWR